MRILIAIAITTLTLASCTKKQPLPEPICKSVFKATTGAAHLIANTLQCTNVGAIAADLSEPVLKLGLCAETTAQSTVADLVCPQIATLVSSLAAAAVPAAWQCSMATISDIIKEQITSDCAKVIK